MDEQVESAITDGLRNRGVDALTIQEDGRAGLTDRGILNRSTELDRAVFTRDYDFLVEAAFRQRQGLPFAGVIYAHLTRVSIGACVRDLELLAGVLDPEEIVSRVIYLPIR
jgi:predicted nuclease of predicted toxin-antitoxin system